MVMVGDGESGFMKLVAASDSVKEPFGGLTSLLEEGECSWNVRETVRGDAGEDGSVINDDGGAK